MRQLFIGSKWTNFDQQLSPCDVLSEIGLAQIKFTQWCRLELLEFKNPNNAASVDSSWLYQATPYV